jgi:hypothetical protein
LTKSPWPAGIRRRGFFAPLAKGQKRSKSFSA